MTSQKTFVCVGCGHRHHGGRGQKRCAPCRNAEKQESNRRQHATYVQRGMGDGPKRMVRECPTCGRLPEPSKFEYKRRDTCRRCAAQVRWKAPTLAWAEEGI